MSIKVHVTSILLLGVVAVSLSACSSDAIDRARVSGTVSYNGQPLETGMIELYPIDGTGGPSTGGIIEQGQYEIPADKGPLVEGAYQVRITSMRKTGKTFVDRDRPNQVIDWPANLIPAQYNTQSTLKVTIASDRSQNKFDFDLQSVVVSGTTLAK